MRVVLGRLALLLGVVVVGAMAWYGATALFGDDAGDETSSQAACVAVSSRTEVRAAQRAFVEEYGDARWFSDAGVKRTDDGFVLQVTYRKDRPRPDLPACHADVPVVTVPSRSSRAG